MFTQIFVNLKFAFFILLAFILSVSMLPAVGNLANAASVTTDWGRDFNYNSELIPTSVTPEFTSSNSTIFNIGIPGSFTITASGDPPPTISYNGSLPLGVNFDSTTATLSGTPAEGTAGSYPIIFIATNGVLPDATQNFTLTINLASVAPTITAQPTNLTVTAGQAATFMAAAAGSPIPAVRWEVSSDGTSWTSIAGATSTTYSISVTETSMTGNQYHAIFTNSAGEATSNAATLTVNAAPVAPAITNANNTSFTEGLAGTFALTVTGTPTPTVSYNGTLPTGVNFDSTTATLSGTPAEGTTGSYPIIFTATNGVLPDATQNFTLIVYQAPSPLTLSIAVPPTIGESVDAPLAIQPVIKVTGSDGNPLEGITVVASRGLGTGTLRGTLAATSNANGLAAFTDLGYNKSGEAFTIQFTSENLSVISGSLGPLNTGLATNIRVESASNGSGNVIFAQNLNVGSSLTVYGIARDQYGNYAGNPANTTWSLIDKTGGITDTDLDSFSGSIVTFTGHQVGSAVIGASITGLTSVNSGIITVTSSIPIGGGIGGGSEGAAGPENKTVIISGFTSNVDLKVNSSGIVQSAAQLKLDDGNLILEIPQNAQLIDAKNKALETITGSKLSPLLASLKGSVIVAAYELSPDGAQFNPPLNLTIKFDPQSIPKEADGGKITLYFWDGNKWVMVDSNLDIANNTLTTKISHFSQYALMASLTPAKFSLSELKFDQDAATADNALAIQTIVTNIGGSPGVCTAVLKAGGVEVGKQDVGVEAGKSKTISFTLTNLIPGKYSVEVEDQIRQFIISEPNTSSPVVDSSPQPSATSSAQISLPGTTEVAPLPAATAAASLSTTTVVAPTQSAVSQPTPPLRWIHLGVFIVAASITVIILVLFNRRKKHA